MPGLKQFAGGAKETTITQGMGTTGSDPTAIVIIAQNADTYPAVGPFVVTVGHDQPDEERMLVTARTGNQLTVPFANRGYDGTPISQHNAGATLTHGPDADTIREANAHVNDHTRDDHTQYLNAARHNDPTLHQLGGALGTAVAPQPIGTSLQAGNATVPAAANHVHTIPTGFVTSAMIADGTIVAGDVAAGTLTGTQMADASIPVAKLSGSITPGASSITSAMIVDGTIQAVDMANGAVGPSQLANSSVTLAKTTGLCDGGHAEPADGFSPSTLSTFTPITGGTVTLSNPSHAVCIFASSDGYFSSSDSTARGQVRVGISIDGGSTWTYQAAPEANCGTTDGFRNAFSAGCFVKGTPTGTIQARIEYNAITTVAANHNTAGVSIRVFYVPA